MSGNGKGTPGVILEALYAELGWSLSIEGYEALRYETFSNVLIDTLGMFGTDRTCKEKWKQLIKFGYFTQLNQYACTVNLEKIRIKLGIESEAAPDEGE